MTSSSSPGLLPRVRPPIQQRPIHHAHAGLEVAPLGAPAEAEHLAMADPLQHPHRALALLGDHAVAPLEELAPAREARLGEPGGEGEDGGPPVDHAGPEVDAPSRVELREAAPAF